MSPRTPVHDQLVSVVSRACALVDEETSALQDNRTVDHSAFVARKDMIAFELGTIARAAAGLAPTEELRRQFEELSVKLEKNRKLLEIHIGASRQIARMLADVVRAGNSDGTYSVRPGERVRSS